MTAPTCTVESHGSARHCASLFARLVPVGIQAAYDEEDEYVLLVANCPACHSSLCRTVRKGCDEAVAFEARCKEAA